MRRFLVRGIILCGLVLFSVRPGRAQDNRILPSCPFDIIIALDFSGSEIDYLDEIRTALVALTSPFELEEGSLKVGIVTFNRGAQVVLPLTGNTAEMDEAVEALRITSIVYATDIHAGIELAGRQFRQRSAFGVPKFLVLVSDGDPHAHARGRGFQADLTSIDRLKKGDLEAGVDPVHVFTLYTGRFSPYQDHFDEVVRKASIQHMRTLASDERSFFYFEQYPLVVDFFKRISNCQ